MSCHVQPLEPKGYTVPLAAESPGDSPRLRNPGADRSYRPEAFESSFDHSIMASRSAVLPPPPRPSSPVRSLHISNAGDIDITMERTPPPPPRRPAVSMLGESSWHSGGNSRAGHPASTMASGWSGRQRPRRQSPAEFNRSVNNSIRYSSGPLNKSIFVDAPVERTSPVGAESFNRRYNTSVRMTGRL